MGKLSHIEDVEERQRRDEAAQAASEEAAARAARQAEAARGEAQGASRQADGERLHDVWDADAREDFHGISTAESMSTGHKALIIVAVVVLVAALAYIANYWLGIV